MCCVCVVCCVRESESGCLFRLSLCVSVLVHVSVV